MTADKERGLMADESHEVKAPLLYPTSRVRACMNASTRFVKSGLDNLPTELRIDSSPWHF